MLAAKKVDEALAVFQYNATRNGDQWPIHVGLARAYAAEALPQAPDAVNKQSLEAMVKALSAGQSIN